MTLPFSQARALADDARARGLELGKALSIAAVATNGGFAQSADDPLVSEDEQTVKLRLVETVARYYWGNEL
jgi:hypothetical protein